MKKISILLTITALIVMSIIFLASCDPPLAGSSGSTSSGGQGPNQPASGGQGPNQPASGGQGPNQQAALPPTPQVMALRKALTNIQTFIGPAGPTQTTLEEDAIALVPLLPTGGIAALDFQNVMTQTLSLVNIPGHRHYPPGIPNNPVGRIGGLEALVVNAALAADAVAADRNNDQASQDLVAAVELIEIIVLGPLQRSIGGSGTISTVPAAGSAAGIEYQAAIVAPPIIVYSGTKAASHDQTETDTSIVTLASFRNRLLGGPDIAAPPGGIGSGTIADEVASGGSQQSLPAGTPTGITALTAAALALAGGPAGPGLNPPGAQQPAAQPQVPAAQQPAQPQVPAVQSTPQVIATRQALIAIQTLIGPAGATQTTLLEDVDAIMPLLPATGFANLQIAAAGRVKILALKNRIDPPAGDNLEELVVTAALAADAVAADRSNDQASQDLVAAVQLIEILVLGPPGHGDGIVTAVNNANTNANLPRQVVAGSGFNQFHGRMANGAIFNLRLKLLGGNTITTTLAGRTAAALALANAM